MTFVLPNPMSTPTFSQPTPRPRRVGRAASPPTHRLSPRGGGEMRRLLDPPRGNDLSQMSDPRPRWNPPMTRPCPILDRPTASRPTPYRRGEWSIVRCEETGFIYLADPPDYRRLETEFAWEKTHQQERTRRAVEQPVANRVSRWLKHAKATLNPRRNKIAKLASDHLARRDRGETMTVVDIGCGGGQLLQTIAHSSRDAGIAVRPIGIEVSRQLASDSRDRLAAFGGEVLLNHAIGGAASLAPGGVSLVLMSSFLEHEAQPLRLLRTLLPAMAPGGAIILKVPNFASWNRRVRGGRWCGFRYPDHVNYFTPATLARLASEAGWSVVRQRLADRSPISDNMYATLAATNRRHASSINV